MLCSSHYQLKQKTFPGKEGSRGVEMKGGGERSPNHATFLKSAPAYVVYPVSQMHVKSVCTSAVCTPCPQVCTDARTCARRTLSVTKWRALARLLQAATTPGMHIPHPWRVRTTQEKWCAPPLKRPLTLDANTMDILKTLDMEFLT